MKLLLGLFGLGLFLSALPAQAQTFTFRVRHTHTTGSCQGRLRIANDDVRYETEQRNHARIWPYVQLKRVESKDSRHLSIITYEDSPLPFVGDRSFNFELLDGDVSDKVFNFLLARVGRSDAPKPPVTPPGGRYEIAVKHQHFFGGCEGTLRITPNFIEYLTAHRDARLWKYIDIKRIRPKGSYRLYVYTYEDQILLFGRDKVFKFELKEPLEPVVLEFLQARLRK
jgi:hypothetical protein